MHREIERHREYQRAYYQRNKERVLEAQRERRAQEKTTDKTCWDPEFTVLEGLIAAGFGDVPQYLIPRSVYRELNLERDPILDLVEIVMRKGLKNDFRRIQQISACADGRSNKNAGYKGEGIRELPGPICEFQPPSSEAESTELQNRLDLLSETLRLDRVVYE